MDACEGLARAALDHLGRSLLFALLSAEDDQCTSQCWGNPLQDPQLDLSVGERGRSARGRSRRTVSLGGSLIGDLRAEYPAVRGGGDRGEGQRGFDAGVRGDAPLPCHPATVGDEKAETADQVGPRSQHRLSAPTGPIQPRPRGRVRVDRTGLSRRR